MPLQQLVEYFNDRLEQEHNSGFRPFALQNDCVNALFGAARISSDLKPIRKSQHIDQVIGHTAHLRIASHSSQTLHRGELEDLLALAASSGEASESIINIDRLSRAVHMLNYLPQAHLDELLFLDVDPRHILGVKEDHGAYFEEVIVKCGLQTNNVTITININNIYSRYYQALLKGIQNYQRRGYRLALKFGHIPLEKPSTELIAKASPDFVGLSILRLESQRDPKLADKLQQINHLVDNIGAHSILFDIDDELSATLASSVGTSLVQGEYFETPLFNTETNQLRATA